MIQALDKNVNEDMAAIVEAKAETIITERNVINRWLFGSLSQIIRNLAASHCTKMH